MKRPYFDTVMVVLDCQDEADGSIHDCRCLRSNDGCGRRRAGSRIRTSLQDGHRYVAVVFSTDPLESGSYKLRLKGRRPRVPN